MESISQTFYSIPEIWDLSLEHYYIKQLFLKGFLDLLGQNNIPRSSLILDAGCGSGFPALDLIEKGYRVVCVDKSSEMIRQIGLNAQKRGISIEAYNLKWQDVANHFENHLFDLVYCRGNSLIYAASWEQNWVVPDRSREEITKSLQNFYHVLKPNGMLYLDITNKNEKPHETNLGIFQTQNGLIEMKWKFEHDIQNHLRTWAIALKSQLGEEKTYLSYSYLFHPGELEQLLQSTGFKDVKEVGMEGETNYAVYLARKQQF